ncbi:immunoglobulin superfamily DCC subclass member 4 [Microcaecilia unicolor]|uniref:immunoglobulin superfamily DCC subclass member 4 n=1 Tax=Microcaecilia unicolor TaxID=1415580 RepID=UPI00118723CA|nr:immunoglobulin superfamily DCC subclass member 4 [Microcaecilia unicolor]
MALGDLCWIWGVPLLFSLLLVQGKMPSLELSCSAGPHQVVLEPNETLMLDCMLGVTDQPMNVTWKKDGVPLLEQEHLRMLPNGSLVITQSRKDSEEAESRDPEGRYSCTFHTALGAVASRTVQVRSAVMSRFLQHPEPQSVHENGLVRFQCRIDGLPAPTITWEKDHIAVPSEPRFLMFLNGALQIRNVQETDAGSYRCLAANTAGTRYSNEARLTVIKGSQPVTEEVTIVAAPQNTTVVAGQSAILECAAAANPSPRISWMRRDGDPIPTDVLVLGEVNLLIPHTQPHHAGVYVCRADKPGTQHFAQAEADLRVLVPPFISQYPKTISRTRASTARFVCRAEGEPAPAVSWLRDGLLLSTKGRMKVQPGGSLVINQIGLEDAGYYQCLAESSLGTVCATATLFVIVREGLPSAPQHVTAVPLSSTSVTVSWQRPEQNSQQIIGFSLHYQKAAGVENIEYQFAVNNDTLAFHVRDLEASADYKFYVVAYSQLGASRPSASAVVRTWEDVPAAAPQLSLSSTSSGDIQALWVPLASELSNGKIIKYKVEYCPLQEAGQISTVELPANQTQVMLRSLQAHQEYKVRIAAGTAVGYGTPSEWTQHRTPNRKNQTHVPLAPTDLKVKARMESLLVMWQPPANHTKISGYKLYHRKGGNEGPANQSLAETNRNGSWGVGPRKIKKKKKEFEITGLDPQVKKELPLPPTHVHVEPNSSTSVWLRWKKPGLSSTKISSYTVRCSPRGMKNTSLVTYYASTEEALLIGGLKPYTKYEFAVRSDGVGIEGPFGSTVERFTLPDRPATPPSDVQLTATGQTWAQLHWQPPTQPNGVILEYIVVYSCNRTQHEDTWTLLVTGGDTFKMDVNGLESNTRYFFRMGARTIVGSGPYSSLLEVYTLPEEAAGPLLDIHAVTGIIVGVCLALLCILFCVCVSCRKRIGRQEAAGMDPAVAGNPSYYPQMHQGTTDQTPCSGSHELESLMSARVEDLFLPLSNTPVSEDPKLIRTHCPEDDGQLAKLKLTWNGSVRQTWASKISSITSESPATASNGSLRAAAESGQGQEDPLAPLEGDKSETQSPRDLSSSCCRLQADVIVHSNFSASEGACAGQCEEPEDKAMPVSEEWHSGCSPSAPDLPLQGNCGDEGGCRGQDLLLSTDRQTDANTEEAGESHGLRNNIYENECHGVTGDDRERNFLPEETAET